MKKLLLVAATLAAMTATPVLAQSATDSLNLTSTIDTECVFPDPTATGTGGTYTNATSTVDLSASFNSSSAVVTGGTIVLTYADAYCNYAHNVSVDSVSAGLIDASPEPIVGGGTFVQRIGYSASAAWAAQTAAFSNPHSTVTGAAGTQAAVTAAVAGAARGDLVLTLTVPADANPVLRGTYTDTLTVQIGAAL